MSVFVCVGVWVCVCPVVFAVTQRLTGLCFFILFYFPRPSLQVTLKPGATCSRHRQITGGGRGRVVEEIACGLRVVVVVVPQKIGKRAATGASRRTDRSADGNE